MINFTGTEFHAGYRQLNDSIVIRRNVGRGRRSYDKFMDILFIALIDLSIDGLETSSEKHLVLMV